MFSDTYKITEVKGVVYEVVGKWETRKSDDIQLEGANASAEEADEGTETTSQTGIDIVLNHRLTETGLEEEEWAECLETVRQQCDNYSEELNY